MLSFENDYNVGAHPRILERLMQTNLEPQSGYGADRFCESAKARIREAFSCPNADIFFLTGGFGATEYTILPNENGCFALELSPAGKPAVNR